MPPTEHELRLRERLSRLRNLPLLGGAKLSGELDRLQRQIARIGDEATDEEIWHKVELARHEERPYTLDYVERLLDDWFELHGDRAIGDDGASPGASACRTRRATARQWTRWSSPSGTASPS
jgi:acetyl-CoA carboxylase carboxyl transferase subunit alpha